MTRSDNELDVDIHKSGKGWKVTIQYFYYKRRRDEKEIPRLSSVSTYCWYTECKELIEWFQRKRTKVFYSQIRVLCKNYGNKERDVY